MCKKLACSTFIALVLGLAAGASAELLVQWNLDEGSGTVATDTSGNGRDGTFTGDPQWVAGHNSAGALHFDGVDDFVVYDLGQAETFAAFSVAFWVKADTLGQPNYASPFTGHFPNTAGFQIDVDGGDPGEYRVNPGGLIFGTVSTDWVHLALTAEGTSAKVYYNGEWVLDGTLNDAILNQFAIGVNRNRNWWFACTIDDLRVYDHALSEAEILGALEGKPFPFALGPTPADGALHEATWASLSWTPGALAVSHDVYLGDNFDDVNDGAEGAFVGNQATTSLVVGFFGFPIPGGLVPGATYYWRIDEVNDADPNSPWKGNVWSFTVPPRTAYSPSLADGAINVLQDVTLSWTAGFGAQLHQVYFGDNFDDVNSASGAALLADTTYTPGTLELEKTYYWRVDEFAAPTTHIGNVWSFTTVPDVAVTNPDLQGWWTLDEGEGVTAVDWSGHGGHGSFVGEPQWVDGFQGTALEFGGGDFVNCGDNAAPGVTADFTLAAWIKMNPGNAGQYMGIGGKLSRLGGNADYMGYALVRHSSNVFRLWVGDGDAANIIGQASSDMIYTDTDWHHIAGVRDGQINALYVDGIRQTATTNTGFIPSDLFFQIGRQYSNTNTQRQFTGKIDDVRVYNKVLTDAQIAEVMLGDKKMAGSPTPGSDSVVDFRDISSLSFSAGDGAASHDVYFGQDRGDVAGADNSSPEFQGNQAGTNLSLATLVEFGGGDYYWRIDEVAADGTVTAGTVWKFTVPDGLIVDNFESYDNIDPLPGEPGINRIFDKWIDGFETPTNGALAGNDLPPYAEQSIVHGGAQSMIYLYDNAGKTSEATLTVAKRDWTGEGVTKLSLWFRGASANAADRIFVALNGTAVVYHDDASATQITGWNEWIIDLATFGVDLTNVNSITIGIGAKNVAAPAGGAGTMYFDDILLIR